MAVLWESSIKSADIHIVTRSIREALDIVAPFAPNNSTSSIKLDYGAESIVSQWVKLSVLKGSSTGEIDATRMYQLVEVDMKASKIPLGEQPFPVIIIDRDLRYSEADRDRVIGGICPMDLCVIITVRTHDENDRIRHEAILRQATLHEVGHSLSLISQARTTNVVGDKTYHWKHCGNDCVMRANTLSLTGLTGQALKRAMNCGFCSECRDGMVAFVKAGGK